MKGIVLVGVIVSRLSLPDAVTNRHLLPAGNYPMSFHPVARLKKASNKDILVVTGRHHMGVSWSCCAGTLLGAWQYDWLNRQCALRCDTT
jgi:dTDP-glucose pyrophosphorylase